MLNRNRRILACIATVAGVITTSGIACGAIAPEAYPSTYHPPNGLPTFIFGATVLTGTGTRLDNAAVSLVDGRVQAVGVGLTAPAGARLIDASGRWVTPGLIDVHSHLGVSATPQTKALDDANEMTDPVTANVWAEHSIWPQDPGFATALAGGVTTLQILPGSANLIGGRSVILKNVPAITYQAMKFPGAPYGLKMACGENPKGVYGERHQSPSTRMGSIAAFRQAFAAAQDYQRQWQNYDRAQAEYERKLTDLAGKGDKDKRMQPPTAPVPPARNLKMETLLGVLKGEILVHVHCYRADEMATMLDLADEFHFKITAFHHGVEAYKIADLLAQKGICAALWADWWGFKMEAYDGIQENIALVDRPANGCAMVHSDSAGTIQRLNQEAAKAMARGNRVGLDIPPERAIRWITSNPARALGLGDRIGSLEPGKLADVVIWNRMPFSVYALADQVFIDGVLLYDRLHPATEPRSDFLLGQPGEPEQP
jgi:imidazolonepropionase-like amidohydrolase